MSRFLSEWVDSGGPVVGVDRDGADGCAESVAEHEEPSGEGANVAVGADDWEVGGEFFDLRVRHGPGESGPVRGTQGFGHDQVQAVADRVLGGVSEQRFRTGVQCVMTPVVSAMTSAWSVMVNLACR